MSPTDLILRNGHFLVMFFMIFDDFDISHRDWIGVFSRSVRLSGPKCPNVSKLSKCVKSVKMCLRIPMEMSKIDVF